MKKTSKKILVIHGPNLNLLGKRETSLYGSQTLNELNRRLDSLAKKKKYKTIFYQSNVEGNLINHIQKKAKGIHGLLINPAAYTHTSVALRDTLLSVKVPTVEVHMTNIYGREPFRKHSLISDVVSGQVVGFGTQSYDLGLHALINTLERSSL